MSFVGVTPPDPLGLTRHPTCHPQTGCVRSAAQYTPTHHPSPSIHTGWVVASGNNPPSMNGRRRVRGWGALGCSNLTASGPGINGRRRVARALAYHTQIMSGYYSPMHPNPSPFSVHSYWVGCCQWELNPQPDL